MLNVFSYPYQLHESISNFRVVGRVYFIKGMLLSEALTCMIFSLLSIWQHAYQSFSSYFLVLLSFQYCNWMNFRENIYMNYNYPTTI